MSLAGTQSSAPVAELDLPPVVRDSHPQPSVETPTLFRDKEAVPADELDVFTGNTYLQENEQFLDAFVSHGGGDPTHPLHVLLDRYAAARAAVTQSMRLADGSIGTIDRSCDSVWDVDSQERTEYGRCGDNRTVAAKERFQMAVFQVECVKDLEQALGDLRQHAFVDLVHSQFDALVARAEADNFVEDTMLQVQEAHSLDTLQRPQFNQQWTSELHHKHALVLRKCLDVLFYFLRHTLNADSVFVQDVRAWARRVVSALSLMGSHLDHRYILNHVVRLPGDLAHGFAELIMFPPRPLWTEDTVNHILALLDNFLRSPDAFPNDTPVPALTALAGASTRSDAATNPNSNTNSNTSNANNGNNSSSRSHANRGEEGGDDWVWVGETGDKGVTTRERALALSEDACMAILEQFPLATVLAFTLGFDGDAEHGGHDEHAVVRVFAVCRVYIRCLGRLYSDRVRTQHRSFSQLVSHNILACTRLCSEYLNELKAQVGQAAVDPEILRTIQANYDCILCETFNVFEMASLHNEWSFWPNLDLSGLSLLSLWRIFGHLLSGGKVWFTTAPERDFLVNRPHEREDFARRLADNPGSGQFLMNLLASMATSRHVESAELIQDRGGGGGSGGAGGYSEDEASLRFVCAVVDEVFYFSFVCPKSRRACVRHGCDALETITRTHPAAVSMVLACINTFASAVGKPCIKALASLRFDKWVPTRADLAVLKSWTTMEPGTLHAELAERLIFQMDVNTTTTDISSRCVSACARVHVRECVSVCTRVCLCVCLSGWLSFSVLNRKRKGSASLPSIALRANQRFAAQVTLLLLLALLARSLL